MLFLIAMKPINSENFRILTEASADTRPEFLARHFTLAELAAHWHMSVRTLRDAFANEPGVIRYGLDKLSKGKQRTYVSVRIPESVAWRVYDRLRKIHKAG
jgi:hypothetical protein